MSSLSVGVCQVSAAEQLLTDVVHVLREGYADTMDAATIIEIIEINAQYEDES